jgi:hypothetical protein
MSMKSHHFASIVACAVLGCAHDANSRPANEGAPTEMDAAAPSTAQADPPRVSSTNVDAPRTNPTTKSNPGGPPPVAMADAGATTTTSPSDATRDAGGGTQAVVTPGPEDRSRDASTLTPLSQGNSEPEIRITAAIRRAVMGDGSLGFDAKNVKIITVGSTVTLRGPVPTERERSTIEAYAKKTPGVSKVDDQIEVHK